MSSISPPSTVFSPPHGYTTPYKYEDPTEHHIPRSYPDPSQYNVSVDQTPPHQQHQRNQPLTSSDPKGRLRKACDSCSVRKVKCDESGPPCKSCAALDIPCTFERPSRRRGPPNRHAEEIKRRKLGDDGSYSMHGDSPTHDAAYSLAALATPAPLSAESICDMTTLEILLEDYFTFIHPLVPIPHEPSFRAAFARREDRIDRSFLALLAAMIETLVASFPRRPRQLFTSEEARKKFPNAGALIDKCQLIFNEARGIGHLDRDLNLYDACGSYLVGLAAGYLFDMDRLRMYFGECVLTLRRLSFHKPSREGGPELSSMSPDLAGMDARLERHVSYIEQESGRRLFWLCFVGCLSIRQLGGMDGDILMPPMSHAELLPPMPREIDDDYIFDTQIMQQHAAKVSSLTGFNLNVRIYRSFHALTALEMAFGANELYDWDRQRRIIRQAISNVKLATQSAPPELQLIPSSADSAWPPTTYSPAAYSHLLNGRRDPTADVLGLPARASTHYSSSLPYPKRAVQYEIQKANIYASQLATRSYLVEKFWNLYEIRDAHNMTSTHNEFPRPPSTSGLGSAGSPTVGTLVSGLEHTYQSYQRASERPLSASDDMDADEQAMAVEREDIVRDLAILLRSINQVNMEPNGLSFCHKIRQVASTLLETKRARMSVMPTLDSESVNNYLLGFLDIISKLERVGSGRIRGSPGTTSTAEVEEEELVHWASLKEHQERFVRANGFVGLE